MSCTRHKWKWFKNVVVRRERGFTMSFIKRGKYQCQVCGEVKYGAANREELT